MNLADGNRRSTLSPRLQIGFWLAGVCVGMLVAPEVRAQEPPPGGSPGSGPTEEQPEQPADGSGEAPAPPESPEGAEEQAPEEGAEAPSSPEPSPAPGEAAETAPPGAVAGTAAPEAAAEPEPEADEIVDTSGSGLFEQSQAGGAIEEAEGGVGAAPSDFDLNGYVRGDLFVGKVPGFRQGEIKAGYGELALQVKVKPDRHGYGDGYAEFRLRYGLQGEDRELFADLREAYVNAYLGPFDFRFGHQIIVWGRADAINPTNNLTPLDLSIRSPVEDDRRVGNIGARMFVNLTPVRLEGVWMPLYSPVKFPAVPFPQYVAEGDPDYPAPELSNGLGAGRVHLELSDFEMSGSYLYGYAPFPGLALQDFTVGVDPPEVRVSRTAYNHHVVGFDFSTALGDVLAVRGEAAYRRPLHHESRVYAPRPDLQYVLGVDRSFGPVSVIAQYLGRYVFDWQRETEPDTPVDPVTLASFTPPLPPLVEQGVIDAINQDLAVRNQLIFQQTAEVQHLASLRLEWLTLHETLSLSALGMVNFTTREWLVYPKLRYQLSDRMSAYLGGELYVGPEGTLLGLIDETMSAGYAELRYSY